MQPLQHRLDRRAQPFAVQRIRVGRRAALALQVRRQRERSPTTHGAHRARDPASALAIAKVVQSSSRPCGKRASGNVSACKASWRAVFGCAGCCFRRRNARLPATSASVGFGAERAQLQVGRLARTAAPIERGACRVVELARIAGASGRSAKRLVGRAPHRARGLPDLVVGRAGIRARRGEQHPHHRALGTLRDARQLVRHHVAGARREVGRRDDAALGQRRVDRRQRSGRDSPRSDCARTISTAADRSDRSARRRSRSAAWAPARSASAQRRPADAIVGRGPRRRGGDRRRHANSGRICGRRGRCERGAFVRQRRGR